LDQAASNLELIENLEQILSTLRHELGNPVNSLKITLDVLQENYDVFDDDKKKDYLKRVLKLLARQERLVEAMKSYSRFNAKEQEEIPFIRFWEHFLNMTSKRLKDRNIKFIHNLDLKHCLIKANNMALNRVMTNLLDNAMEAVEKVSNPEIGLIASRNNGFVIVAIKDNGPGIRKNDLTRIFIPLYTTKPDKMGMGLPIARKLLSKMDGRIEMKNPFGKGTEVRVWLRTADRQKIEVGF